MYATIPKGNMGYDQYTVSDDCSCQTYFCCFPLALANTFPWPFVPILSNFFEKKRTQNHPQCLSGLSRALFPTTFLEIAVDYVGNWESLSRVFVLGKSHPPRAFPLLEDSEFLMMLLSLIVILSSCIASLKVLNYDLEDHLKKVHDCVRFIQTIPMVWASFAHSRCPLAILEYRHTKMHFSVHKYISLPTHP